MGWLVSLFFLISYFVSRDPGAAVACGLFGVAGAIEIFANTVEKCFKSYNETNKAANAFLNFMKAMGESAKKETKKEERP